VRLTRRGRPQAALRFSWPSDTTFSFLSAAFDSSVKVRAMSIAPDIFLVFLRAAVRWRRKINSRTPYPKAKPISIEKQERKQACSHSKHNANLIQSPSKEIETAAHHYSAGAGADDSRPATFRATSMMGPGATCVVIPGGPLCGLGTGRPAALNAVAITWFGS
jgi:hypothetical protein